MQDKLLKRNRGFVFGTRVEIREVSSDKSESAACKRVTSFTETAQCFTIRPEAVFSWLLSGTSFCGAIQIRSPRYIHNFHSWHGKFIWQTASLNALRANTNFQNILTTAPVSTHLWRAINHSCQEKDANLGEGYTSSQQATDEMKKKTKTLTPKNLLPLGLWDYIESKTNLKRLP